MGKRYLKNATLCIVIGMLFLSCTTRQSRRIRLLNDSFTRQDYRKTIETIQKSQDKYGNLNRFLYWFDLGLLYHYIDRFDSSILHLEKAEQVLDELYARSVTNEIASIMTNDNLRPYRPRRYEQILLHQFLAFNYLARNEIDEALVEMRKVRLVFERFQSKDKGKDKYNDDGMAHFLSSILYDAQGDDDDAVIALYKAVSAYRNGPVPIPAPVSDLAYYRLLEDGREEDIDELQLAPEHKPENVPGLYDSPRSEIILIGYAGLSPILGETVYWGTYVVDGALIVHYRNPYGDTVTMALPAPPIPDMKGEEGKTKSGTTFHIKFALPSLVKRESQAEQIVLMVEDSSGKEVPGIPLTDTDLLLEKELEDNHARIIARTALRVVLRTIAQQRTKKALQTESPLANLFVNVGTDLLADQLEKADTRLCFLLPQTIHIARIPVSPGRHTVKAVTLNNGREVIEQKEWQDIFITEGKKKFVFYPTLK